MRAADYVVDMGPGAGEHGGHVVAQGTAEEIMRGQGVADRPVPVRHAADRGAGEARRKPTGYVEIVGASQHNLKNVDVKVPLGVFCAVTGVSGLGQVDADQRDPLQGRREQAQPRADAAGRAQAHQGPRAPGQDHLGRPVADRPHAAVEPGDLHRALRPDPRPVLQDAGVARPRLQGRAGSRSTSRAAAARSAAATARSRSRCTSCRTSTSRASSATASATTARRWTSASRARRSPTCSTCRSKRRWSSSPTSRRSSAACRPCTTSAWTTCASASRPRRSPAARPSASSSRAELAKVATGRTLYILDEPTTGLHFADIQKLLEVLQRLVDAGNSVVVIEHNLDVIKTADRIIDMGPEGGEEGGQLMAAGTPEEIAAVEASYTGRFLRELTKPRQAQAQARAPASARRARSPRRPERRAGAARRRGELERTATAPVRAW